MPETIVPIVTNVPQYYSASKGTYVPVHEMEQHHLDNAIKKLQRDQSEGAPVPINVLNGLLAEQQRRRAASGQPVAPQPVASPTQAVEITPVEAATKATVDEAAKSDVQLGVLAASLATVTSRLTRGAFSKLASDESLRELAEALNQALAATGGVTPEPETYVVQPNTAISALDGTKYPHLTSKLLVNSLQSYGITTLQQLATLAPCDFGAIRFSTAEAYAEVVDLFTQSGLTWNFTSSILSQDGFINRILNPNASSIDVFVREANNRLRTATAGLQSAHSRASSVQTIDRIFSGIKRRLSLAASVLGTSLLARGHTAVSAQPVLANHTNVTAPFRKQVIQYLQRVSARVARIDQANTPTTPAAEAVEISYGR